MLYILIAINIVFILTAIISTAFAIRFFLIISKFEISLGKSLDILDESYRNIGKILERPLFFDSAEVRSVIMDIKKAQESILFVANEITADFISLEDNEENIDLNKINSETRF